VLQSKTLMGVVSNRTVRNGTISIRARPAGRTRLRMYDRTKKVYSSKLGTYIGFLEKRLRNGWRERQVTLVVSHKALP
jgi:hypothetical protein